MNQKESEISLSIYQRYIAYIPEGFGIGIIYLVFLVYLKILMYLYTYKLCVFERNQEIFFSERI